MAIATMRRAWAAVTGLGLAAVAGAPAWAQDVLGDEGMPSAGLHLPDMPDTFHDDAFEALCRWLETSDGDARRIADQTAHGAQVFRDRLA